jgi:hypothetical protein
MKKRQTRTYNTVGEMFDARQGKNVTPTVAAFRAAGAFVKPEGVAPTQGTKNPTNVGNPCPKGPTGQKGTVRNDKRRAAVERKQAQRKVRAKRR